MTALLSAVITRLVRHPVSMQVKAVIRDARWRLKGTALRNPPLPDQVNSLLFVCLGNICRSPFAGMLAHRLLTENLKVTIVARSAGIKTTQSGQSPPEAVVAAAAYGVSLESHRPVPLTPDLMASHDLIIVMELEQMVHLQRQYPESSSRIVLLSLFDRGATGYERYNIEDPFMRPSTAYAYCYRRIHRAVTSLCEAVDGRAIHREPREH